MSAKWHGEVELPREQSEALREQIRAFIAGERGERACFLTTLRRDGRPLTRPVNALVTGWSVETVTQDIQYKTGHVRANPVVSYLWVSAESRPGFRVHAPRSVFLEGRARLLEHPASVEEFFRRRVASRGAGAPRGRRTRAIPATAAS